MRRVVRMVFPSPHGGGAPGAARDLRGVVGFAQAAEPGCGADPHVGGHSCRAEQT
jgi:hypothetical protein